MARPFRMIPSCRILTLALVSAVLLCVGFPAACRAEEPRPVDFKATDGVPLHGYLFGEGTSGVILAHMYPADQKSWFPLARKLAGASAIGVGTALFYDPLICTTINQGIADYLDRHGMANVSELTGTLRLNGSTHCT